MSNERRWHTLPHKKGIVKKKMFSDDIIDDDWKIKVQIKDVDRIKIRFVLDRNGFKNYIDSYRKAYTEEGILALRSGETSLGYLKAIERRFVQEKWLLNSEREMFAHSMRLFGRDVNA